MLPMCQVAQDRGPLEASHRHGNAERCEQSCRDSRIRAHGETGRARGSELRCAQDCGDSLEDEPEAVFVVAVEREDLVWLSHFAMEEADQPVALAEGSEPGFARRGWQEEHGILDVAVGPLLENLQYDLMETREALERRFPGAAITVGLATHALRPVPIVAITSTRGIIDGEFRAKPVRHGTCTHRSPSQSHISICVSLASGASARAKRVAA